MKSNPALAKRMSDANESLESNPIEVITIPSDKCPHKKCDGTGWLWIKDWSKRHLNDPENPDEWKEPCDCYSQLMKQREISRKLDLASVPTIFKHATVHSFDPDKYTKDDSKSIAKVAKKAAENFVKNYRNLEGQGKGLYLYSDVKGSGKTRLISSISNALVKVHGVDLAFITADDLLSQVKKTYRKESEMSEDQVIKMFRNVEVLVIDDVAVEKTRENSSEFAERIFFNVLNYRLDNRKTTLFTSNKTIDDLTDIYREGRVHSRIKKMAIEIYMPEESIRDQEAESENEEFERILFE